MTSNVIPMRKIKRTMRSLFPGGVYYDNDSNCEGSSSSTIFIIVTFTNHNTSNFYHYTTIAPPTFLFNNTHTLLS